MRLITFIAFLAVAPASSAQPGRPVQKIILRPQIKAVKSPQSTTGGMAKLLPLQNFTIEGRFFHDLRTKNKIHVKVGATQWTPSVWVATIVPTSATTTALTAQIPALEVNQQIAHLLAVEVEGSGTSDWHPVVIGEMNITGAVSTPHIKSISPAKVQPGASVTLEGFFRGNLLVFVNPLDANRPPFSLAPSTRTQKKITFTVPVELPAGGYKISVGESSETRTKTVGLAVEPRTIKGYKYAVAYESIKCLEETADGPGSDEPYAIVWAADLVQKPGKTNYPAASWLFGPYTNVDTGNVRKQSTRIWPPLGGTGSEISDPSEILILIALLENDRSQANQVHSESLKEAFANFYLLAKQGMNHSYIASRLRDVWDKELKRLTNSSMWDDEDEQIGGPQELSITSDDLKLCREQPGWHFKSMNVSGDGGKYRVTFSMKAEPVY